MLPTQIDRNRSSEAGFTLIELSIVLIIIGLLIGGVLQGQEMINNTRIKTTVSQTDSIQAAVQTFQDKFGDFPGDFDQAAILNAAAVVGNADGVIDLTAAGAVPVATNTAIATGTEAANVFDHLNEANLLQGVRNAGTAAAPIWVMDTRIDNGSMDVGSFLFAAVADGVGIRLRDRVTSTDGLLSAEDAFGLDTKYDDGVPNTGRWEASDGGNVAAAGDCANAGAWGAAAGNNCIVAISIH